MSGQHRRKRRISAAALVTGIGAVVVAALAVLVLPGFVRRPPEPTPSPTARSILVPVPSPSPSPSPSPLPVIHSERKKDVGKDPKKRKEEGKKKEKKEKESYDPTGHLRTVDGHSVDGGNGPTTSFTIEVEDGIMVDPDAFARDVELVLFDRRSWPGRFERVDHGTPDFRLSLASPELTDELCLPLDTAGTYSCFQSGQVVLNSMRWKRGADSFGKDLKGYRVYMINHEVGHALGHDHVDCPSSGGKAPIMMQQTKGVGQCEPNPWP